MLFGSKLHRRRYLSSARSVRGSAPVGCRLHAVPKRRDLSFVRSRRKLARAFPQRGASPQVEAGAIPYGDCAKIGYPDPMEVETVHALVLRRRDSGEDDRQMTVLTAERGVVDVIAKGARKGGSRLAGSSEPFSVCTMSIAPGRKRRYVMQTQPITSFPGLRADFDRMTIGLGLLELALAILPHDDPAPRAFKFLVEALHHLEGHPKPIVVAVWAEVVLMSIAGFQPRFDACAVTGQSMREAEAWVSPSAGGYVVAEEAIDFRDRFRVRFEVLVGLAKIGKLEAPPKNLKFAKECLRTLVPFWAEIVGRPLPAHDASVREIAGDGRP